MCGKTTLWIIQETNYGNGPQVQVTIIKNKERNVYIILSSLNKRG